MPFHLSSHRPICLSAAADICMGHVVCTVKSKCKESVKYVCVRDAWRIKETFCWKEEDGWKILSPKAEGVCVNRSSLLSSHLSPQPHVSVQSFLSQSTCFFFFSLFLPSCALPPPPQPFLKQWVQKHHFGL